MDTGRVGVQADASSGLTGVEWPRGTLQSGQQGLAALPGQRPVGRPVCPAGPGTGATTSTKGIQALLLGFALKNRASSDKRTGPGPAFIRRAGPPAFCRGRTALLPATRAWLSEAEGPMPGQGQIVFRPPFGPPADKTEVLR